MRPNRVKIYKFESADLTANSLGSMDSYSEWPINGLLYGVHIGESNWAETGSLFLNVSGPELTIWSMVSGTARGIGVNASGVTYPRATTVATNAITISGTGGYDEFAFMPLNSVLHLVGSKLGVSKSGTELNVIYI